MAGIGVIIGTLIGQALPATEPMQRSLSQNVNSLFPNMLPSLGDVIDLYFKRHMMYSEYIEVMSKLGYNVEWSKWFLDAAERVMSEGDLLSAWRRGIISEDELTASLLRYHYSTEHIAAIKEVSQYFPSPSDLIRFAVREVYSPAEAEKFGQFQDIPQAFLDEAWKAGLPEEQAKNYWAAHWELPSVNQGFEMLHRRVIDEETLKQLLKAQDVMPYWRDKMQAIAHQPLTRVDVRRMYALGVLNEDAVYNSYLDLGYNDENARRMTEFTIRYETNEDLGLTRSTIINAYKEDLITQDTAIQYLKQIGYADNVIELTMNSADYDKYETEIKLLVEDVRQQYRKGVITLSEFKTILSSLDLPSTYVNAQITKEELQKTSKIKVPTKNDVDDWLSLEIINEQQYGIYLKRQGYLDEDIAYYLTAYTMKQDTMKRKFLGIAVYQRWLVSDIISESAFTTIATDMKIKESDINNLILEARKKKEQPEETQ